ncbi:fungal pheromone STE3G-protein-coupled receptor, partial [Stereum hirsutum FP-91666 SS1]|uniref:fungal pheromone STE3G-protein-coupled receptor n=1 Tax=Stereum hirsutum (strain FP-91666) TaxID=721885 RepID=UPI000444A67C
PNHVFSAFSFIAFVMCAVPAYWHLEAWNTGTLLYMFWTGVPVLNMFINSIVWDGNALNSAPVWCDISSRIIIGSNVGIVLSSLCINRRLYKIASAKSVVNTAEDKRRAIIIDLAIGLGIPLIQQVMYVIVEGHRFNIVEDVGCWPAPYVTPVAIALIFTWPVVIGMISITYSAKTVLLLYRHRRNFKSLIQASHNLNSSRYIRLMCLGGIEILTLPFAAWALAVNIQDGVFPWISWADTHSDFGRVVLIPAVLWRSDSLSVMNFEIYRWFLVLAAFVFFSFFGFADEARKHYRLVYTSVASRLGYSTASMSSTGSSSG